MNVNELLAKLPRRHIALSLDGERLRYRAPVGTLTAHLRAAIAHHREEIIDRFRRGQPPDNGRSRCMVCDRRHWVDAPPKDGRIRTTCGRCGRFIGYRPVKR